MARAVPALLRRAARRRTVAPQHVIEAIGAKAEPGTIVSAGVGQHQMWASQYWKFEEPGTWINSGGAGTWALAFPRRSAPKSDVPIARSGASTGTAVSR